MELWTIGNKAGLLAYVVAVTYFGSGIADSRLTLAYLAYICLNVAVPIFRRKATRRWLVLCSSFLVIFFAITLHPLFVLLLPASFCEWMDYGGLRHRGPLVLMLIPLLFAPEPIIPVYILAAALTYLLHASNRRQLAKREQLEADNESMRADLQRLHRTVSENNEFIRQSAYTIKLEERNRLSQQIHDEVGHAMAGALIQMEASRRLIDADKEKAAELLGNAIAISKEGLERIRLTLKDMKPRSEELGMNRLRLFVDELAARHGMTATLTHDGNLDLITPNQWRVIQQNATEAVTNSFKYGEATSLHVSIHVLNRFVKAVVADNGKGAEKIVKGLGIVGMEERAAALGGTVIVDGGNGFSVTTLLPHDSGA